MALTGTLRPDVREVPPRAVECCTLPKRVADTSALCILSNLFGNASMTRVLVEALNRQKGLHATYVIVDAGDYARYPVPWWAMLSDPWQAQLIARRKARAEPEKRFDVLWVHGWENAVAFQGLARTMPSAVTLDAVPATLDRQLRVRGVNSWKRSLSYWVHHRAFRAAAARYDCWLPMASDCADSLKRDYGVDPKRCLITLTPQDTEWWAAPRRGFGPPWRALFVGNDFDRKGGDFLLRLYQERLAETCTLTIVSNDPALASRKLPRGVEWIRGAAREQVRRAYWNSHVFLFPTRQDFAPQVLAEASAAGLPVLATGVGGVPDLVRDGESGFIFPLEASVEEWAERIHRLFAEPETLRQMSDQARRFAQEHLSLERFDRIVSEVVDRLRSAERTPQPQ